MARPPYHRVCIMIVAESICDIYEISERGILPELVLNANQTPSSYVSVGESTMTARGEKSVSIKGLTGK